MPKIVLHYFPVKALGEGPRLLLAYGGEGFEDNRIPHSEWPAHKSKMPFGQMPVMEIDGRQYAQGLAICRFLGRRYKLAGADAEEDFQIDQNVYFINDIRNSAAKVFYESDPVLKAKLYQESADRFTSSLDTLDKVLEKNNGHIALGKLTWGDFVFAGTIEYIATMTDNKDLLTKYPRFGALHARVVSLPGVKEFVAAEPPMPY